METQAFRKHALLPKRRLKPADPIFDRIARYRRARIAHDDAWALFKEATDAVDCMLPVKPRVSIYSTSATIGGREWVEWPHTLDARARKVIAGIRKGLHAHWFPGGIAQAKEHYREAKATLNARIKARDDALESVKWNEKAAHLRVTSIELTRAERAVLWAVARTPAGLANQITLLRDEMQKAHDDHSWGLGSLLWHRAGEFLQPLAKAIERGAQRLGVALAEGARP